MKTMKIVLIVLINAAIWLHCWDVEKSYGSCVAKVIPATFVTKAFCDCHLSNGDYAFRVGSICDNGCPLTTEAECVDSLCTDNPGDPADFCTVENSPPAASGLTVSGAAVAGQKLVGSYIYSDADSDPEGVSTFQWYRAVSADASDKTAIDGAVSKEYTPGTDDIGKYLCFQVTPIASSGPSPGMTVSVCTDSKARLPGDADGNNRIELADAVLALKIAAGMTIPAEQKANIGADVNGDRKIGMAEAIYVLVYLF